MEIDQAKAEEQERARIAAMAADYTNDGPDGEVTQDQRPVLLHEAVEKLNAAQARIAELEGERDRLQEAVANLTLMQADDVHAAALDRLTASFNERREVLVRQRHEAHLERDQYKAERDAHRHRAEMLARMLDRCVGASRFLGEAVQAAVEAEEPPF